MHQVLHGQVLSPICPDTGSDAHGQPGPLWADTGPGQPGHGHGNNSHPCLECHGDKPNPGWGCQGHGDKPHLVPLPPAPLHSRLKRGHVAPSPRTGLGALPWGDHGAAGPGPGGQLRAWHGRSDAPTLWTTALGARPHPIGNRYPTPTHRTLDSPPGGPLGLAGAVHHPVPAAHPVRAAPSAGRMMHQRRLQPAAVTEAAAQDPPGAGGSTLTHTGTFTAERSPPGHPHHVEQAQILHRHGTPQVPGDAGRKRSPQPHPGTGRARA